MLYLLLSALLYAINNFFWKTKIDRLGAASVIWGRSVFTLTYSLIVLFLIPIRAEEISLAFAEDWEQYLLAATLGLVGLTSMTKGLKYSTLSELSFFQTWMAIFSGIGISIIGLFDWKNIISGSFIIGSFFYHQNVLKSIKKPQSLFWFSIMAIAFVCSGFITWNLIQSHLPIISIATQELTVFAVFSVYGAAYNQSTFQGFKTEWLKLSGFAAIIFAAIYFSSIGLQLTDPFLLSLSGLISPFFTALFGVHLLKEQWTKPLSISLILILIGLTVIAI